MFSLFIIFIAIKSINAYVDKEGDNLEALKVEGLPGDSPIQNYTGLVFHAAMTILIVFSFLNPLILNEEKIYVLIADGLFQFFSTLLIAIIGIINPFSSFTPTLKALMEEGSKSIPDQRLTKWLLEGRNWQYLKIGLCLAIVIYFYFSGFLVIPSLNQGFISGLVVFFITMFIITSILQLIKNPVQFKKQVLFRVNYLFKSIKKSFFISVAVIVPLFLFSIMLDVNVDKILKVESIALLVYNIVMTVNEYKILKLKKANDVSSAL